MAKKFMLTEEFILVFLAVTSHKLETTSPHEKAQIGLIFFCFSLYVVFLSDLCSPSRVMFCEEGCA